MNPQHNSSGSSYNHHWRYPAPVSSQPSSQFPVPPNHYVETENAHFQATNSYFPLSGPVFSHRDGFNGATSIQSSVQEASGVGLSSGYDPAQILTSMLQDLSNNVSSQPNRSNEWPMHPPSSPRSSMTLAVTPLDWENYRDVIRSLYIDQNKSLPETMKIMEDTFRFTPSLEKFKAQFKIWNWSKYLPTKDALWMEDKASKRKREENKDTIFEFRGQTYTTAGLQQRRPRKKNRQTETGIPRDAPTPSGIKYTTPRNEATSPSCVASAEVLSQQPIWTPPPSSNAKHSHQLNLVWNGRTKANLETMFQEAQELEQLARIEEAENKFCEALNGFENLLSATHESTAAVAYRLASFYAQNDRMTDAYAVLDWVTGHYVERFGNRAAQTVSHLLRVVDMFVKWAREEDAKAFFCRIIGVLDEGTNDIHGMAAHFGDQNSNRTPDDDSDENPMGSMDNADSSRPVDIDFQLSLATGYTRTNDKAAEPLLLRLIENCERHPKDLAVQSLRCRNALLALHYGRDEQKLSEALDQSEQAFWKISELVEDKTQLLFQAATELARWFVKAERYKSAEDLLIQIQSDALEVFSGDQQILLFQRIGLLYQNEGRWDDAKPWFEQALAACYRSNEYSCVAKGLEKGLEAALEKKHYSIHCSI